MNPEERLQREVEKFRSNIAVPRPGTSSSLQTDLPVIKKHGIELSDVLYVSPQNLKPNPLNDYPPLAEDELAELVRDIKEKGILVPLISRLDDVLICGHNRLTAAIRAELEKVPVQRVLSALTTALEQEIMKSENDRRRGGRWTKEQKEEFIQKHFAEAIERANHGGDRKSKAVQDQSSMNLDREIEKKSRGKVTAGTAKRLVAKIRKEKTQKAKQTLPSKMTEKLSARLKTVREVITLLETKLTSAKKEEKALLKELKSIE